MALALDAARLAAASGEVPVGAVVTAACGAVLGVAGNRMRRDRDACAHAEMLAMRQAINQASAGTSPGRLEGCDLWVTLEPCAMCAGAAGIFRVERIVFAAYDAKGGAIVHGARLFGTSRTLFRPEIIGGLREIESRTMLQNFFRDVRLK